MPLRAVLDPRQTTTIIEGEPAGLDAPGNMGEGRSRTLPIRIRIVPKQWPISQTEGHQPQRLGYQHINYFGHCFPKTALSNNIRPLGGNAHLISLEWGGGAYTSGGPLGFANA